MTTSIHPPPDIDRPLEFTPEDIIAIHREAELAEHEMAAVRADASAGRCTRERFDAALNRSSRAKDALRAIAKLDATAAAVLAREDRALDESVDATLALRANRDDPGVRARWQAAMDRHATVRRAAQRATSCAVTRAVRVAVARCADAAPRRLPRSRSRRRHRATSRPAVKATAGPDGPAEPPGIEVIVAERCADPERRAALLALLLELSSTGARP